MAARGIANNGRHGALLGTGPLATLRRFPLLLAAAEANNKVVLDNMTADRMSDRRRCKRRSLEEIGGPKCH